MLRMIKELGADLLILVGASAISSSGFWFFLSQIYAR
jgi:hypothetical protein